MKYWNIIITGHKKQNLLTASKDLLIVKCPTMLVGRKKVLEDATIVIRVHRMLYIVILTDVNNRQSTITGHGSAIGYETGKIIAYATRNKRCEMLQRIRQI